MALPNYKEILDLLKRGATMEAQEAIMTLREAAVDSREEVLELKKQVTALESQLKAVGDWEAQKERYSLVSPWRAGQAYALKRSHAGGEEAHWMCTNCFHNSKRVILNPIKKDGWVLMACPSCKATINTDFRGIGSAKYAEDYSEKD